MTAPEPGKEPGAKPARRTMTFRKSNRFPPPTPDQSRRQADVVQSAWIHFGEPGPVIAFLNARHSALEGQPLHLAIESDEGLERVQALLSKMTLMA